MVGGKISSVRRTGDKAIITVRGIGSEHRQQLHVETEYKGEIPTGSSIWWQARHLMICPPGAKRETDIGRVGYSY